MKFPEPSGGGLDNTPQTSGGYSKPPEATSQMHLRNAAILRSLATRPPEAKILFALTYAKATDASIEDRLTMQPERPPEE